MLKGFVLGMIIAVSAACSSDEKGALKDTETPLELIFDHFNNSASEESCRSNRVSVYSEYNTTTTFGRPEGGSCYYSLNRDLKPGTYLEGSIEVSGSGAGGSQGWVELATGPYLKENDWANDWYYDGIWNSTEILNFEYGKKNCEAGMDLSSKNVARLQAFARADMYLKKSSSAMATFKVIKLREVQCKLKLEGLGLKLDYEGTGSSGARTHDKCRSKETFNGRTDGVPVCVYAVDQNIPKGYYLTGTVNVRGKGRGYIVDLMGLGDKTWENRSLTNEGTIDETFEIVHGKSECERGEKVQSSIGSIEFGLGREGVFTLENLAATNLVLKACKK